MAFPEYIEFVEVGLYRLIDRRPTNFKRIFKKIYLEQNLAPKYAQTKVKESICS
jgi:hypothetical protein